MTVSATKLWLGVGNQTGVTEITVTSQFSKVYLITYVYFAHCWYMMKDWYLCRIHSAIRLSNCIESLIIYWSAIYEPCYEIQYMCSLWSCQSYLLIFLQKQSLYSENVKVRERALTEHLKAPYTRLETEIFANKMGTLPGLMRFHPYDIRLAVADSDTVGWVKRPFSIA